MLLLIWLIKPPVMRRSKVTHQRTGDFLTCAFKSLPLGLGEAISNVWSPCPFYHLHQFERASKCHPFRLLSSYQFHICNFSSSSFFSTRVYIIIQCCQHESLQVSSNVTPLVQILQQWPRGKIHEETSVHIRTLKLSVQVYACEILSHGNRTSCW